MVTVRELLGMLDDEKSAIVTSTKDGVPLDCHAGCRITPLTMSTALVHFVVSKLQPAAGVEGCAFTE